MARWHCVALRFALTTHTWMCLHENAHIEPIHVQTEMHVCTQTHTDTVYDTLNQ